MAGFRSALPLLGLSSAPSSTQGGVRSLLAPWVGGASAPSAPATQGGYRSLLGFWIGGASAGSAPTPPTPGGNPNGGGGYGVLWQQHARYFPRVYWNEYDSETRAPDGSGGEPEAEPRRASVRLGARKPDKAGEATPAAAPALVYQPLPVELPPGYYDILAQRELERRLRIEDDIVFVLMLLGANA